MPVVDNDLIFDMAQLRGTLDTNTSLAGFTWFKVGGNADYLYRPLDDDDLCQVLTMLPAFMPLTIIGAASNLLVRDGGVRGLVIRLGRGFGKMERINDTDVFIGAGVPDINVAKFLCEQSLDGGAFLRGIPGTIGGALAMNAGAYGKELRDIFVECYGVTNRGKKITLNCDDMQFSYRHCGIKDVIFTGVKLRLSAGNPQEILAQMNDITAKRQETQPVKSQTGGSTFKNPQRAKAWELIHDAGCRGFKIGDAQISELHSNFMINNGNATAYDIELLGETVRKIVFEKTGVKLEWEIKRIGDFDDKIVERTF
jgi:UDP-N-acetylmuramate dehydrogenase